MRAVGVLARYGDDPAIQQLIDDKVGPKAPYSSAAAMALALQRACDRPAAAPTLAATTPTPAVDPARSRVDLQDLLEHLDPDDLKAGITLTGRHEKKAHQAVLNHEGQIKVLGRPWRPPTTAARARDRQQQDRRLGFLASDHRRRGADPRRFRATRFPPTAPV